MLNKKWTFLAAGAILVFGIILSNVLSRQKEPMRRRPSLSTQKPVTVLTVENRDGITSVEMSGPLYAYDKIDLYAEVSGVLCFSFTLVPLINVVLIATTFRVPRLTGNMSGICRPTNAAWRNGPKIFQCVT